MQRLTDPAELDRCAAEMVATDPWLTFQRTYEAARAMLDDPAYEVWGTGSGFVVYALREGYIRVLCVFAGCRGQGTGRRLLEHATEAILALHRNVWMCVSSFNPRALALYERFGFQRVGKLDDYVMPGPFEHMLRISRGPLFPSVEVPVLGEARPAEVRAATGDELALAPFPAPWLRPEGVVACVDGVPRAFAWVRPDGSFPTWVEGLWVASGFAGVEGALLAWAEGLGVNTFLSLPASVPFSRDGYAVAAVLEDYLAPGVTQHLWRRY